MNFKQWLLLQENSKSPYKLGLYPDLYDVVGQYPPLYNSPRAADYITYAVNYFGKTGAPPGKNGIHWNSPVHYGGPPTPLKS